MKNQTTIQRNIWVAIDEVYVTIVVTAKRVVIYNERYLSAQGRKYVIQCAKNLNPAHVVLSKQQRQVKRLPKNQTRATLLAIKQSLNDTIKNTTNNKKLSTRVKGYLLGTYNKMKAEFQY